MSIDSILSDPTHVALVYRQKLEPVEGRELPIFPPTYAAPTTGAPSHGTPYTVNRLHDGTLAASLDSVQSQANRMETIFGGAFDDTVPQIVVKAGVESMRLTDLSHRLADAAVRCTDMESEIHDAFEEFARGNCGPIARLGPTSLVYGAWDSRDTQVKIPRAIRAEIVAHDIQIFTRSAQFSGAFSRKAFGFGETEWKRGAEVGFAPTPSVDQHGGVVVRGDIIQSASIHLGAVRSLRDETGGDLIATYAFGLALVGLLYGARDYQLRSGCWMVPAGDPDVEIVHADGSRMRISLDAKDTAAFLRTAAKAVQKELGIPIGVKRVVTFDTTKGKQQLKKKESGE